LNAAGGRGFESFTYSPASSLSNKYRDIIHKEIVTYYQPLGIPDRGRKHENFKVLREAEGKASILLELLFIDNPEDARHLDNPGFIEGLAGAMATGIGKALGVGSETNLLFQALSERDKYKAIVHSVQGTVNQV
jgi:N-acetylmuramoyl-L-alanine amidase